MQRVSEIVSAASDVLGRELRWEANLAGGQHAVTIVVTDGSQRYVVRGFPPDDTAVRHEVGVLGRLGSMGGLAPSLIGYCTDLEQPLIITEQILGSHPPAALPASTIATEMARALAVIHRLDGEGLRIAPSGPPEGAGVAATSARRRWANLDTTERVLTHYDFWCGNALWSGAALIGVVDWSGARHAPRGVDVAWCRLDLVLVGSVTAADLFLTEYEQQAEVRVHDIGEWDLQAAAQAEAVVEEWSENYRAVGRAQLTADVLRQRLDTWISGQLA